jgi:hypothetical protein
MHLLIGTNNAHLLHGFHLIMVSSTCFELPNVHLLEDLQSGRCQDVCVCAHPDTDQTAYMDARKKYHKTACTSLPEDEH